MPLFVLLFMSLFLNVIPVGASIAIGQEILRNFTKRVQVLVIHQLWNESYTIIFLWIQYKWIPLFVHLFVYLFLKDVPVGVVIAIGPEILRNLIPWLLELWRHSVHRHGWVNYKMCHVIYYMCLDLVHRFWRYSWIAVEFSARLTWHGSLLLEKGLCPCVCILSAFYPSKPAYQVQTYIVYSK